jgi:hypothetical protein
MNMAAANFMHGGGAVFRQRRRLDVYCEGRTVRRITNALACGLRILADNAAAVDRGG